MAVRSGVRRSASRTITGAEELFDRNAFADDRADEPGDFAWTPSLDRSEAIAVVGIVRTAVTTLRFDRATRNSITEITVPGMGERFGPRYDVRGMAVPPLS